MRVLFLNFGCHLCSIFNVCWCIHVGAFSVACLGATEAEWKLLAMRSLRAKQVAIAKNAFARLKDAKFLSLIENIEKAYVDLIL